MKLTNPINIDLLKFIRTGEFDYIKMGQTKDWIINNFSDPDDIYKDSYNSPIWFYGNIEFHFNDDNKLFLIYLDHINNLKGGQSLHVDKWIFDKPKKLTIQKVTKHLTQQKIGYQLKYGTLSNGFISAAIEITASGVSMGFSLPENEKENYDQYLERLKTAGSNLFLIYSISLMKK